MIGIFEQFVTLWVVIDPIGTIPVFVAITASMSSSERVKTAIRAALIAACVLLFFLVAGQFLLEALDISLPAFQIAGGLILFLFALTMIFDTSKPEAETAEAKKLADAHTVAVFPLAVPSLASPGAMLAIVLLTDNNRFSVQEQIITGTVMVCVVAVALGCMLLASPILRVIGNGGAAIVSRVMGMVLAAVAVDAVINGITELVKAGA
ncbi:MULTISPECIES: MarC family protein [unclassified Hoeflea]|uniref:MarC family protein n=1 Tax=unclassified Hoeflea TaxID=2614931 RepID=UPI00398FBC91